MSVPVKTIETKTQRLKLPIKGKPYWVRLSGGISLGYRRTEATGTWSVRIADGKGGAPIKRIGAADDHAPADGKNILTYVQARDAAQRFQNGGKGEAPVVVTTLGEAIDAYERDLEVREADLRNASRLRHNIPAAMLKRPVGLILAKEYEAWRNDMKERLAPSGVNRLIIVFKAVLHLAERHTKLPKDWVLGLKPLPNTRRSHNNVRTQDEVVRLVHAAREQSPEFGLLIEVMVQTGARYSQVARCEVRDLLADALMVPASYKGKDKELIPARVPLPDDLIARLRLAAGDRPGNQPLLRQPHGGTWAKQDIKRRFERIVQAIGGEKKSITGYALRHTHITAQLLDRIPVALVAKLHDTSVKMIEQHYASAIASHSDDLVRRSMLQIDRPQDNVVPLRQSAG